MSIRRIWRKRLGTSRERSRFVRRGLAEQGSTMVEMALTLVILLTMLFGVIEMCLALYSYHFIAEAAREGTRYAIVRGSSCQFPSACPAQKTDIQNYVQGLGYPGINPSNMTVTTNWFPYPAGGTCSPSLACNNPGNLVQVQVQYQFPLSIPFIPARTLTMTSTSQMIISQ